MFWQWNAISRKLTNFWSFVKICVRKLPGNGTQLPKYLEIVTHHELFYEIYFILFYYVYLLVDTLNLRKFAAWITKTNKYLYNSSFRILISITERTFSHSA